MVYDIQLKNLVSLLSGGGEVATFGRSLLSGFTSGHKKMTLISGGSLLSEIDGITVCSS